MDLKTSKRLREIYKEVCAEVGLKQTLEGWSFFKIEMFEDYMAYCERVGRKPCFQHYKRNAIEIAKEMIQEVCNN